MWSNKGFGAALLLVSTWAAPVLAAPCCSAGSALPSLVTNDDRAQISLAISYSDTVMDAPGVGRPTLRSSRNADESWAMRLSGAMKFAESWQLGVGTSLVKRTTRAFGRRFEETGLGDADLSIGYEVLPEWSYSIWKPRGWFYAQTVFPSGKSIYDPSLSSVADSRGQGVLQSVLGLVLSKSWGAWDMTLIPEARRLHVRTFDERTSLSGAWGGALLVGAGFSWSEFRAGLRVQPAYQGKRRVMVAEQEALSLSKVVWNSGIDLSYLIGAHWATVLSYSDQTWFGPAHNTTLERGLSLMLQHKWEP